MLRIQRSRTLIKILEFILESALSHGPDGWRLLTLQSWDIKIFERDVRMAQSKIGMCLLSYKEWRKVSI